MSGNCSETVERCAASPLERVWHVTCSSAAEINLSLKEGRAMYEPHYEEETGGGGFLIGLLCGTALGAAIGLMFAPKAGSEFRQRLYESTGDIRRKAYETYDQASEQVNTHGVEGPSGCRPWPRGVRECQTVSSRSGNRRQRNHVRFWQQPEPAWRFRLQQRPPNHGRRVSAAPRNTAEGRGQRAEGGSLLSRL